MNYMIYNTDNLTKRLVSKSELYGTLLELQEKEAIFSLDIDHEIAFKDSRLGWDYYYNKLQGKIQNGIDPAEAILSTVLNMGNTHRPMLYNYLFGELYPDKIEKVREMHDLIEEHKKRAEEKRLNKEL